MRRAMTLVGALILATTMIGCSSGRGSPVTVLNSTSADLYIDAWIAGVPEPVGTDDPLIGPGDSFSTVLEPEDGGSIVGAVVRVRSASIEQPAMYRQMTAPGPYVLRVSGDHESMTMERERMEGPSRSDEPLGIPRNPTNPGSDRYGF